MRKTTGLLVLGILTMLVGVLPARIPEDAGFWRGEHEPEVQAALSSLLRPSDVVCDVGAHLGLMALGIARLIGPSGRVVGFDGDPSNIERLQEARSRNHLEQLQTVHAAVWSRTRRN